MVLHRMRRPPPPEEGNEWWNTVAVVLTFAAFAVTVIQISMFGHLRTVEEAYGRHILSGWTVTIISFGALLCLALSATFFEKGFLKKRLALEFIIPLAISSTLFVYSNVVMLTRPTVIVTPASHIELPAAWSR